jgi:exodeoxyribonuclease III
MRVATWNVNSLKARLPRVEEFLAYANVDVLCLQETKLSNKTFPALTFQQLGYDSVHHGQGQWNGVAILSRVGLVDASDGFGTDFVDPYEGDARLVAATCAGVRVVSVYVPNGRAVDTEHYDKKLRWLEVLRNWIAKHHTPADAVAILGDWNVAPTDRDVWSSQAFEGSTHVTAAERAALARLEELGFTDAFRAVYPDVDGLYSYWDYRAGDFHQHRGMRIDLAMTSGPVTERVTWAVVDRNARKGTLPSDHAPVIFDLSD